MNAHKLSGIKLVLQTLNRLSRNMRAACRVDYDVFVGCFDPEDLVDWHEDIPALLSNRESRKPLSRIIDRDSLHVHYIHSPVCALQGGQQSFLIERFTEVIHRLDLKGSHRILGIAGDKDK